jgi:hypothetical protein
MENDGPSNDNAVEKRVMNLIDSWLPALRGSDTPEQHARRTKVCQAVAKELLDLKGGESEAEALERRVAQQGIGPAEVEPAARDLIGMKIIRTRFTPQFSSESTKPQQFYWIREEIFQPEVTTQQRAVSGEPEKKIRKKRNRK